MHWLQSSRSAALIVISISTHFIQAAGGGASLKLYKNAQKKTISQSHSKEFAPTSEQKNLIFYL